MFETTALDSVVNRYVDEVGVTPGTRVEADDRNIIQDELVNLIEGKGLTLDPTGVNRDQVLEAVNIAGATTKNAIINGAMLHAQRGASGAAAFDSTTTPANDDDTYLLDRWNLLSDGDDIVDVSQDTEAPVSGLLSCALDVETIDKKFGILQIIEQKNCEHMIGGTVSLSFDALVTDIAKLDNIKAAIIAWDGTADVVTGDIISAWNAEDTTPTLVANWTFENTPANLSVTEAWTGGRYKVENIDIDTSGAKNIGIFIWSDGFCDTLANILRITNVQLEKNSIASDFEWVDIAADLAKCQRYFGKSYSQAIAPGSTDNEGLSSVSMTNMTDSDHQLKHNTSFKVDMRIVPTIVLYDAVGASGRISMAAGNNIVGTVDYEGTSGLRATGTNGASSTSRIINYHHTADAEL